MVLHLHQSIHYNHRFDVPQQVGPAFDQLLSFVDSLEIADEGVLLLNAIRESDVYTFSVDSSMYKTNDDVQQHVGALKEGRYLFYQDVSALQSGEQLLPLLYTFITDIRLPQVAQKHLVVRLFKESRFEIVTQFFTPIQTIAE